MSSNNNGQREMTQEEKDKLKLIANANEVDVLMRLMCEKMGLKPFQTTQQEFTNRFTELQVKSLEYQRELREQYISAVQEKPKQKRKEVKKEDFEEAG